MIVAEKRGTLCVGICFWCRLTLLIILPGVAELGRPVSRLMQKRFGVDGPRCQLV